MYKEMKKKYILIVAMFFPGTALLAQQRGGLPDTVNIKKVGQVQLASRLPMFFNDQRSINGYIVRLMKTNMGSRGYGFDILNNSKSIVHKFPNPMPFNPKGVQNKEEAYNIAEWVIKDFQTHGHWQNVITPHIAYELNIKSN